MRKVQKMTRGKVEYSDNNQVFPFYTPAFRPGRITLE